MGNLRKKRISLSLFFIKYFIYLCIGVLIVLIGAFLIFNFLVSNNMISRADYAQKQADLAYDILAQVNKVDEKMIPEFCQYAIFDTNGNLKYGNISERNLKSAWESVEGKTSDILGNFYKVITRSNEYCVLKYQIAPQFKDSLLRKVLPSPQNLIVMIVICLWIIIIISTAVCFGYTLRKKLYSLIQVTEKIQQQNLNFNVMSSDIKEIDMILLSMDKMRSDLDESLKKQWQLEQSRKEQMAALAHDLKTPLTIMRGNSELLNETILTQEQEECAQYIQNSTLQMQDYVKALIEISHSDNCLPIEIEEINSYSFVHNLKVDIVGLVKNRNIQLVWNIGELPDTLNMNPILFKRALLNVATNAIDFTPVKGKVEFSITKLNDMIEFKIVDSGKGFTEEGLLNATTQFYMEDKSRSSNLHYGMGLYITNSIVKKHNGFMLLTNKKKLKGAEVTILIPCG